MSYIDLALSATLKRLYYTVNPVLPRSQSPQARKSFTCWCHRSGLVNGSTSLTLLGREQPVLWTLFHLSRDCTFLPCFISSHVPVQSSLCCQQVEILVISRTRKTLTAPFVRWGLNAIASPDLTDGSQEVGAISTESTCSCFEPLLLSFGKQKGIIAAWINIS